MSCDIKNVDIVVEVVEEPFNGTIHVFTFFDYVIEMFFIEIILFNQNIVFF